MSRFIGGGGIPADTNPPQPDNGKQWVDTSQSPPEVKIYDGATQAWLPADTQTTVVSQTEPTPERGKIWFEPAQGGTNMYAASSGLWEFLKFLPAFPAAPDAQARFDARNLSLNDGDAVSTWSDTVNGNDLSSVNSAPIYRESGVNGKPGIAFNDSQRLEANFTVTVPYSVFVSGRFDNTGSNNEFMWSQDFNSTFVGFINKDGQYQFKSNGTGNPKFGSSDTNNHIFHTTVEGSNQEQYVDQSSIGSSSFGASNSNGFSVGGSYNSSDIGEVTITELILYEGTQSSNQTDIANFLDRDLGIL